MYVILAIIIILGLLKACIRQDKPLEDTYKPLSETRKEIIYPEDHKNITINGIDYIQSQAPIGKFGGTLTSSTIGEGPKTFNPFNSKDNISSTLSEIMYDGLLTTHPVTGQPIPKLAKSFTISDNGKEYTIKLIHGI